MFKGEVAQPGFGHFRKYRPKFYQTVLALSGVALYRGTINVRIIGEMPHFPLPNTQRIPGQDQIDLIECNGGSSWLLDSSGFQGNLEPESCGSFYEPNY
jgi:hypothetical protein